MMSFAKLCFPEPPSAPMNADAIEEIKSELAGCRQDVATFIARQDERDRQTLEKVAKHELVLFGVVPAKEGERGVVFDVVDLKRSRAVTRTVLKAAYAVASAVGVTAFGKWLTTHIL
jgi:hypothetical protein